MKLLSIEKQLIEEAKEARLKAYAPYSEFRVGAAVLTSSGKIFAGVNVENASYGLTICAERAAIFNATSSGERLVVTVAVVTDTDPPATPCGACRQVIMEVNRNCIILSANLTGEVVSHIITELLPEAFEL